MADLSNKALALLLLVAIVVTLSGTFVSLSRMEELGITGRATDSSLGYTNFTITSNFTISFTNSLVPFGSGSVQAGGPCMMGSNNSPPSLDANCFGFNESVNATNLTIENDGNIRANVSLNFTQNATDFIGGTGPLFRYNVYNHETSSCATFANGSWTPGAEVRNNTNLRVCNNLNFADSSDVLGVAIWVSIPEDAPVRANQVVITAIGCDDNSC